MSALPQGPSLGELSRRIERALANCLALARYELAFDVEMAAVTLRGRVTSYYHKQLAQESLQKISDVRVIRNEIEVRHPMPSASAPVGSV